MRPQPSVDPVDPSRLEVVGWCCCFFLIFIFVGTSSGARMLDF